MAFELILALTASTLTDVSTVVGVIGVVGTLAISCFLEWRAIHVQMAQRALNLMHILIDIERVLVEHPDLAPYFRSGREKQGEKLPKKGPLRDQVLAYALLYCDFAETVGWQIETGQMSKEGEKGWKQYFLMLRTNNPAIEEVFDRDKKILAHGTRWLLGEEKESRRRWWS